MSKYLFLIHIWVIVYSAFNQTISSFSVCFFQSADVSASSLGKQSGTTQWASKLRLFLLWQPIASREQLDRTRPLKHFERDWWKTRFFLSSLSSCWLWKPTGMCAKWHSWKAICCSHSLSESQSKKGTKKKEIVFSKRETLIIKSIMVAHCLVYEKENK